MRVEVLEGEEQHSTVVVQNLKYMSQHLKENLWFVNPGSIVECDGCERFMERASGTSAGALGRSMFAQHKWLCNDCLSRQETGFSSPTGLGENVDVDEIALTGLYHCGQE